MALPIIPFGKYKGQPITALLNDQKTLNWYKDQSWFQEKYKDIYNICVLNIVQNPATTTSSKTPEHNKLQNLFLDSKNIMKFVERVFTVPKNAFVSQDCSAEFEGIFNWDLIISGNDYCICKCKSFETKKECSCSWNDDEVNYLPQIYCEIKPSIGDDYPEVLRKMKKQMSLTDAHNNSCKTKELQKLDENWFQNREEIKGLKSCFVNAWNAHLRAQYVLFVKELSSRNITKEQLVKIFEEQSNIRIVFLEDVFQDMNTSELITSVPKSVDLESKVQSLEEQLETAKKQIQSLEKENAQLKEQLAKKPATKTITDYFSKK